MNSEAREWLSMLAVVIGLVFVGYELQQNTRIQRISATQTLAAEYVDALEVMAYEGDAAVDATIAASGAVETQTWQGEACTADVLPASP